jgi:tetratricopeptide (TPR) repeat protein
MKSIKLLPLLLCLCTLWPCTPLLQAAAPSQPEQPAQSPLTASEQRKLDYFFYEGLLLKNAGKQDAAFEAFRHCVSIDSTAAAALSELSSYYVRLNHPEKALAALRQAAASVPGNFTYRLMLASMLYGLEMYGEASDEYESLAKDYPEKPDVNYFLAEALEQEGEIGKAIDTLDELENMIGMSEPLSLQKYRLYMILKKPEEAFNELKKLAAKYPDNPRYPILIGDLYLEEKDNAQALEYYRKAYAIDPDNPYYTISMASYYETIGQPEAAQTQIRLALMNGSLDVDIKVGILTRYIQQLQYSHGGTEGANLLFQTLLEQHPEDIELKLIYGSLLMIQQNMEEARFQFQLATEMAPDQERAWQQLLNLHFQNQNLDEVIQVCRKCRELFPDMPEYCFYMGVAFYQQEKYQEALEAYSDGLKLIPEENALLRSEFYGQMGDIYYKIMQSDKAFEVYDEALRYNDRNVTVLNNYSYYLSLEKKDLDRAERMSAQCIKLEPNNAMYLDTYAWIFFVKGNYVLAKVYIENAIEKNMTHDPEVVEHYGDILFMTGDPEKALLQWEKAKELGKKSATLDRKIAEKTYLEDTSANHGE